MAFENERGSELSAVIVNRSSLFKEAEMDAEGFAVKEIYITDGTNDLMENSGKYVLSEDRVKLPPESIATVIMEKKA